jgi:hypothetical protein
MPGTVNVPIIGQTNKATLFVAGLAGVGALGWVWYKHNKKNAAATTTTQNPAPATGQYGYGGQQYGYGYGGNYGYGAYTSSPSPYGYGAYGGGDAGYYGYGVPYDYTTAATTTNAQWAQAATAQLTSTGGQNGETVQAALGVYLTGGQLSAAQEQIVQSAIGVEGYPPQPGANGYPPAMNTSASTGQSGTSSANGSTVPNVVGLTKGDAHDLLVAAGFTPYDGSYKSGDAKQKVVGQSPSAGSSAAAKSKVTYV